MCDKKELPLTLIPSINRCISTLYKDPSWSQEPLQGPIGRASARVCSSKIGLMSPEQLQYYTREKEIWKSRGQTMTLTDLWGLVIEYFLNQGVREQEMATFAPSQLPFHTFFLRYFFLTPGAEPSKSTFRKRFLPASAKTALTGATRRLFLELQAPSETEESG